MEALSTLAYSESISERCEAAKALNLPPELQKKLAEDPALEVRKALAQNPNVQPDILFQLAKDCPGEYLENPLFSLLLLENANFLLEGLKSYREQYHYSRITPSKSSWTALFSHPKLPVHLLWAFLAEPDPYMSRSDISQAIALNPGAPPEMLERLVFHPHGWTRNNARENPSLPKDFLNGVLQMETTKAPVSDDVLMRIARSGAFAGVLFADYPHPISEEIFVTLARTMTANQEPIYSDTMLRLIERPEIPAGALHEFVLLSEKSVHQAAARHPNIAPASLLEAFEKHTYRDFIFIVLRTPKAPDAVLRRFVNVKSLDFRCLAARNPGASEELLLQFADQKNVDVRRSVAQNPSCTKAVLEKLSKDPDRQVRALAAKHSL